MTAAQGVRIGWTDLPDHVRAAVEAILADKVVEAVSQPGGFSPGTADRVVTASGARAFVKAVSSAQNEMSPRLHRAEGRVTAALPRAPGLPRLLGLHDDGTWVALVLADIDGRHPAVPWEATELDQVLDHLALVAEIDLDLELDPAPDRLAEDFGGWRRLAEDAEPGDWTQAELDRFGREEVQALDVIAGSALVHWDVRADNLLIATSGQVHLVDWPWAFRGAPWLDTVVTLVNVNLHGGIDVDEVLARLPLTADIPAEDITAALIGLAGFFFDHARRPPSPGLPTVRRFQREQGEATLGWIRRRLS